MAIALHWAIAALIAFNLASGFVMERLPMPGRLMLVQWHVSSGFGILALTAARVVWRILHRPPPGPALRPWEEAGARAAHIALYLLMVAMPLTGWACVSASPPDGSPGQAVYRASMKPGAMPPAPVAAGKPMAGPPVFPAKTDLRIWFGLLPQPQWRVIEEIGRTPGGVPVQAALKRTFRDWHSIGAYCFLVLLALHIAGALKHQWLDGHDQLGRMGLSLRSRRAAPMERG